MTKADKERQLWSQSMRSCWICGSVLNLQTHEIASRAKTKEWRHVENYVRACQLCHAMNLSWMPTDSQLALKLLHDPEHFDSGLINRLRGRAETAVTAEDVKKWMLLFVALRQRGEVPFR